MQGFGVWGIRGFGIWEIGKLGDWGISGLVDWWSGELGDKGIGVLKDWGIEGVAATRGKGYSRQGVQKQSYSRPWLHQTMATSAIAHSLQSQGQPFSFEQQIRTCLGLKSRRRKARRSAGSQTAKFSKSPRAERKKVFGLNFF